MAIRTTIPVVMTDQNSGLTTTTSFSSPLCAVVGQRAGIYGRDGAGACSSPRPLPAPFHRVNLRHSNRPSTRPSRSRTSPSWSANRSTRSLNESNRSANRSMHPLNTLKRSFISRRKSAKRSFNSRRNERCAVAFAIRITMPVVMMDQNSGLTTTTPCSSSSRVVVGQRAGILWPRRRWCLLVATSLPRSLPPGQPKALQQTFDPAKPLSHIAKLFGQSIHPFV